MKFASLLTTASKAAHAVAELGARLPEALGASPDLVLAFATPGLGPGAASIGHALSDAFPDAVVAGGIAGGVAGGGVEVEEGGALALFAASLPGVDVELVHVPSTATQTPHELSPEVVAEHLRADPAGLAGLLVFGDPFTCNAEALVGALDAVAPLVPKVGGLLSGGGERGRTALFRGREVHDGGALLVGFRGDIAMDAVVAQGARPVGEPMVVEEASGRLALRLDGQSALDRFRDVFFALDDSTRAAAASRGMLVGVRPGGADGDVLVRNILGTEPTRGGVAVGQAMRPGDVLQLHVRDAHAASEELHVLLQRHALRASAPPRGVLLVSCLGRGARFYGTDDHDTRAIRELLGDVAVGGFFAQGELGPVRGHTALHGYTSSLALFSRPEWN